MNLKWSQEGPKRWILNEHFEDRTTNRIGMVVWINNDGVIGWTAYALGTPKPISKTLPHHTMRRFEEAGYFRRLRDAMRHVIILHKLEQ